MARVIPFLFVLMLLAACSSGAVVPTEQPVTPSPQAASSLSSAYEEVFEVRAWVNKPNPERDERVTLHGSLIKNGVYLGGMAMQAVWPEEGQERGVPNCSVQVIYQAGVCAIEAADYPSGVYVPITVIFNYRGERYTAETGFTPK